MKRPRLIDRGEAMNKLVVAALMLMLVLGAIACSAADGSVASAETIFTATAGDAAASTSDAVAVGSAEDTTVTTSTAAGADAADAAEDVAYTATDTSYQSDGKSVSISKVVAGSGEDTVTYYVADILLDNGADLLSAFSSGQYGGGEEDTSDMALANDAIVAINGDYYSVRDDGIIIRNGVLYRNVPARNGLAIYKDGSMKVHDEAKVDAEELIADGVWNTYSFGPALLDSGILVEGVDEYEADPGTRHGIQGINPRTGIGIIDTNHFVFVVVDGRDAGYSRGVTLSEFARIFQGLGCTTAYNLDGGGSATLYFMGEVVNQPSQARGERAVSDILFVGQ